MSGFSKIPADADYDHVWLTTKDVANYFGLSTSFFEKLRWRSEGPTYTKLGGKVLYRFSDVLEWANARQLQNGGSINA